MLRRLFVLSFLVFAISSGLALAAGSDEAAGFAGRVSAPLASTADRPVIVGVNQYNGDLYEIDPLTGVTSLWISTGLPEDVFGASTATTAGSMFATSSDTLYLVDVSTGDTTTIGTFSGDTTTIMELGLTTMRILYGTDYDSLFIVDPSTAATSFVGSFGGIGSMWAMTYVPGRGLLGVSEDTHTLYRIDTLSGALSVIGSTGTERIIDLAYDPLTQRLIGSANIPGRIYVLNPNSGAATLLYGDGVPSMMGIAFVGSSWVQVYDKMFKNADLGDALSILRRSRDEVIIANPQGAELVCELYRNYSKEVAKALLTRPRLLASAIRITRKHLTGIRILLNGGKMRITWLELLEVKGFLNNLAKFGSFGLKSYIGRVQGMLNKKDLAAFGIEVVARVGRTRAAPPLSREGNLTTTWGAIKHDAE